MRPGKSSFINWYVGEQVCRTGVAIETRGFIIVSSARCEGRLLRVGGSCLLLRPVLSSSLLLLLQSALSDAHICHMPGGVTLQDECRVQRWNLWSTALPSMHARFLAHCQGFQPPWKETTSYPAKLRVEVLRINRGHVCFVTSSCQSGASPM